MQSFYRKLLGRRGRTGVPRRVDPTAAFTARDWADLPPHHPLSDRG